MKICIDARMMGALNTRGIGRYIEELLKALILVAPENDYTIITREANNLLPKSGKVKTVVADVSWYGFKEQYELPRVLKNIDCDLVHFPHWNVPIFYDRPYVITIHDLLLRHRKNSSKASTRFWLTRIIKRMGYRVILSNAIKKAQAICVPTQFVADDIAFYYPAAKHKIIVTGEGISENLKGDGHGLDYPYLLYVGSAYPHKRLDLLVDSWSALQGHYPELNLVIAGEMDIFMKRIKRIVESKGLRRVHFLGRVNDKELATLYSHAQAFVFPSEFEGFGLPPLEALCLGTPVVCSDERPMPEVLGTKGVIYFKSGSKDGMIEAVKAVVDNLESMRNQAKKSGPILMEKYSWKQAAFSTQKAYQLALKK